MKLTRGKVIAIGTLFIVSGLVVLSSQYLLRKKDALFELINMQFYFNQIDNEPDDVLPDDDPIIPEDPVLPDVEPQITESYVAVLEIPKIDFKRGLYDINSKYNDVNRNVMILSPSDYPDVSNGNFVLAGHSGNGRVSFFKDLYKLSEGDFAYVYYNGVKYIYKITYIYLQNKTGSINVYRPYDKTTLMLITCTKNDNTTQTVYVAELVSTENN